MLRGGDRGMGVDGMRPNSVNVFPKRELSSSLVKMIRLATL